MLKCIKKEIRKQASPARAKVSQWFFKTGKGQYGEGDKFLGLTVPQSRTLAQKYKNLAFNDISKLLKSMFHEERQIALFILVHNFEHGDAKLKQKIYNFYLKNIRYINNWDLVDLSAHKIVGAYLLSRNTSLLTKLARSKNIWERRIAIISTFQFIRNHKFDHTLKISKILLRDQHDLIHKAVGWMLREVGKRDKKVLVKFLKQNAKDMPRTALRYAIEHFPKIERRRWLTLPSQKP
ncbi:MAG: DNA alkylation repair protein [Patescibacteria group bacterium]